MDFFIIPGTTTAHYGPAPEGAVLIDFASVAPFRGRSLTPACLAATIRFHAVGARRANLGGADLTEAYLSGANLSGAHLYGANLRGADLGGADLRGAALRGADLTEADLSEADLSWANLTGAKGLTTPEAAKAKPPAGEVI